ncbi:hypothetical protein TorRG33x02_151710, partial [Trema orientale]
MPEILNSTTVPCYLRPANAPARHDCLPLTKLRPQIPPDFVSREWRSATLKFPATARFFGHRSFTGPLFATPR